MLGQGLKNCCQIRLRSNWQTTHVKWDQVAVLFEERRFLQAKVLCQECNKCVYYDINYFNSPPARWGLLDFIRTDPQASRQPCLPSVYLLRQMSRQSSSPSVSPILFTKLLAIPLRQLRIAVSTAGPQPAGSDRSKHGPQPPGSDRSEHRWPQPPGSKRSEHHWTSTPKSNAKIYAKSMPEYIPNRMPKCASAIMPGRMSE